MASQKIPAHLLLACCECGLMGEAPYDGEKIDTRRLYREKGWFISCVDKDPQHILMAPVCGDCAKKVYPPEFLDEIRQRFGGN